MVKQGQEPVKIARLRSQLLEWYSHRGRDLPWRRNPDPYAIWVSEIMLQQTRVAAVVDRYQVFMARFPTLVALALAREEDVLAVWSGLGYYRRARMLQKAARFLADHSQGNVPRTSEELRLLPGIGVYTAAAIASIAFGEAVAVVDGNVERVLCRLEGWAAGNRAGGAAVKHRIEDLAAQLVDPDRPGDFNQALMELGATVCLPRNPLCLVCPLAACCRARQEGTAAQLPVKLRKREPVRLTGTLLVVRDGGRILLRRRDAAAKRMAGFWDLPSPEDLPAARIGAQIGTIRHTITHHHYTIEVRSATAHLAERDGVQWFTIAQLAEIPFSTTARKALHLAGVV